MQYSELVQRRQSWTQRSTTEPESLCQGRLWGVTRGECELHFWYDLARDGAADWGTTKSSAASLGVNLAYRRHAGTI